ncbi:hypothetical protein MTR72_27730 [Bradyrhizobium sp. ISRA442]|uniref:hypothetical protein n=1 Tax=Bradyrhizobium sp. ISRA442 TaxID=2866197 RepID=UPI00311AF775
MIVMPLSQRHICVPAADGDDVQLALAGCAAACPINRNDHARAKHPARVPLFMSASIGVVGTFQGNVDTVPYYTPRLLKSAVLAAILSIGVFPDCTRSTFGQAGVSRELPTSSIDGTSGAVCR